MSPQVVPEQLLLQFLKDRLKGTTAPPRVPDQVLRLLPTRLEISEEFFETYKHLIQVGIQKRLVRVFQKQRFFLNAGGQTSQVRVIDPEFWAELQCFFSEPAIDCLWYLFSQPEHACPPPWENLTVWDYLFITLIDTRISGLHPWSWIASRMNDWVSFALFLREQTGNGLWSLPWVNLFEDRNIGRFFPLRFELIERFGRFCQDFSGRITYFQRHPGGVSPQYLQDLVEKGTAIESVRSRIWKWEGAEAMGFDDHLFIRELVGRLDLFRMVEGIVAFRKEFGGLVV